MKIIAAPGAFKHSLAAHEVAACIAEGLARSGLGADVIQLPIADGGNGTLDAFLMRGGQRRALTVLDPLGRPIEAAFGLIDGGRTAVIEMALASGLELLQDDEHDPLRATTYGTGQLMAAALAAGATRVIVGMGGSATVDGGLGCLLALGVRALDATGAPLPNDARSLEQVAALDASGLDPRWRTVEVVIASDVDNPTLGAHGAARVFGPQKGASPAHVERLEASLGHFFDVVARDAGVDARQTVGGGAAGALSAGLMALLGGRIESGIDLILEHAGFAGHLQDAALVVTGEGRIDAQTVHGKGPIGVARQAQAAGVPVVAIVGGLEAPDELFHEAGVNAVLPIVTGPMALAEALARAGELATRAAQRLGYLLQVRG